MVLKGGLSLVNSHVRNAFPSTVKLLLIRIFVSICSRKSITALDSCHKLCRRTQVSCWRNLLRRDVVKPRGFVIGGSENGRSVFSLGVGSWLVYFHLYTFGEHLLTCFIVPQFIRVKETLPDTVLRPLDLSRSCVFEPSWLPFSNNTTVAWIWYSQRLSSLPKQRLLFYVGQSTNCTFIFK